MEPTTDLSFPLIQARAAAAKSLTIAASHASASLDGLASWFLAGVGAGLALLLSNFKSLESSIPAIAISAAARWFLWATVLCVIQRYLSVGIKSGAGAAKDSDYMAAQFHGMDLKEFFSQMLSAFPWPFSYLVAGPLAAVAKGDYAVAGRLCIRLSILQGVFVLFEMITLVICIGRLISDIGA